jgi:hypothetical protein
MKGAFSQKQASPETRTAAKDSVMKLNGNQFRDMIAAIIGAGAFVGLSSTRSGDTVVVTLLDGSDQAKAYAQGTEELRVILADAVASVVRDG